MDKLSTSYNYNFRLDGEITGAYNNKPINISVIVLNILADIEDKKSLKVSLTINLEYSQAVKLAKYFPDLTLFEEDFLTYNFELKPEVAYHYKTQFDKFNQFEEFIRIGQGICLKFENYIYKGIGSL